jgi:uncharacterized protein (TIGR00269 family)
MNLEIKFKNTLKKINLKKKEKILVALSGGKDSTLVAYLLHKLGYTIQGFHIDLKIGKYSEDCKKAVKKLCEVLNIKVHIYSMDKEMGSGMCYLRTAIQSKQEGKGLKNCAICGVIKKWIINKRSRELKFKKIATGHNLDDEAQTFLLNILKGSPKLSSNSGPITRNTKNKKFITRIKPLFYIAENDIRKYAKEKKLPVVFQSCPCALDSYRIQLRKFLNTIDTKTKENILKNFERIYDKISKLKKGDLNYCENCKEPCRKKICKKCQLMKIK